MTELRARVSSSGCGIISNIDSLMKLNNKEMMTSHPHPCPPPPHTLLLLLILHQVVLDFSLGLGQEGQEVGRSTNNTHSHKCMDKPDSHVWEQLKIARMFQYSHCQMECIKNTHKFPNPKVTSLQAACSHTLMELILAKETRCPFYFQADLLVMTKRKRSINQRRAKTV